MPFRAEHDRAIDFAQGRPSGIREVKLSVETMLADGLLRHANASGGWGYYAGKTSRIEPTCWALLALGANAPASVRASARDFLQRCQQSIGWLVEDAHWPINIAFNALVAVLWQAHPDLSTADQRRRLLSALVANKGIPAAQSDVVGQDNSLQGWAWTDGTFSWVEPTAWGVIALKKSRATAPLDSTAHARVSEAERLLIDRSCKTGGWNYGNPSMMHQDLRAFAPTTAEALLALQDRKTEPVVTRSLAFLEQQWRQEISAMALSLSMIALSIYGRPTAEIEKQLREEAPRAVAFGNLHGVAMALAALTKDARTALTLS